MSQERLINILRRVRLSELPYEEHAPISSIAQGKIAEGWADDDIVSFIRCMEEFNPDLPEEVALNRMKKISDKYRAIS